MTQHVAPVSISAWPFSEAPEKAESDYLSPDNIPLLFGYDSAEAHAATAFKNIEIGTPIVIEVPAGISGVSQSFLYGLLRDYCYNFLDHDPSVKLHDYISLDWTKLRDAFGEAALEGKLNEPVIKDAPAIVRIDPNNQKTPEEKATSMHLERYKKTMEDLPKALDQIKRNWKEDRQHSFDAEPTM